MSARALPPLWVAWALPLTPAQPGTASRTPQSVIAVRNREMRKEIIWLEQFHIYLNREVHKEHKEIITKIFNTQPLILRTLNSFLGADYKNIVIPAQAGVTTLFLVIAMSQ